MQLTPETAAEIHRIFDDPEPDEPSHLDDERDSDEAPRSPRVVEIRTLLAWIAFDDAYDDDDAFDRM